MTEYDIAQLTLAELHLQRFTYESQRGTYIMKLASSKPDQPGTMQAFRTGAEELRIAIANFNVGYRTDEMHEQIVMAHVWSDDPRPEALLRHDLGSTDLEVTCTYRGKPFAVKEVVFDSPFTITLKLHRKVKHQIRVHLTKRSSKS